MAGYPGGGGHAWVYLNWALALREAGCDVLWLECVDEIQPAQRPSTVARLRELLEPFALADDLVVVDPDAPQASLPAEADALVDLAYLPRELVRPFRRSALVDLDPGLTQTWAAAGALDIDGRDLYATVGEGVADGTALVPSDGRAWIYVPPCVSPDERASLERHGWRIRDAAEAAGSPDAFSRFVRGSRGELSAAKPSYAAMKTGWLSDRTVCYLAAGRPAIVRDTGGGFGLGSGADGGLVRFADADGAAAALERVEEDYGAHCQAARALAERELDGVRNVGRLLERLL